MLTRRQTLTNIGLTSLAAALPPAARADAKNDIVVSFTVLADFVRKVGGNRVTVASLVGPNGDAHVYAPTAADAKRLAQAKLIVINGASLEAAWFDALYKASHAKAPLTIATLNVNLRPPVAEELKAAANPAAANVDRGHGTGSFDPHAWQDIANAKIYVDNIRDGLTGIDPAGKDYFTANAASYKAVLDALDAEVRATIARIPSDRRAIITTHDAFNYFGKAYGMQFIAPQGVSTEAEASPQDIVRIIKQIKDQHIPAVFLENVSNPRLLQRIAKESGAIIGGTLYSDALSPSNGPAATYVDMMHNNIRQFTLALAV